MSQFEMPGGYPHWMLKEIYEQPETLSATLARYVKDGAFIEETVAPLREWLRVQTDVIVAASGSSRHAGMVGAVALEAVAPLSVEVVYASEYIYRTVRAESTAGMIVLSQSGETVDTLAALRMAKDAGQKTLAITNVETSSMAREATVSMPVCAGVERAVPATKSFTAQLVAVELLACLAGEVSGTLSAEEVATRLRGLAAVPGHVADQLPAWEQEARAIAARYKHVPSIFLLGRDMLYPIACEGALKLKESAYLHAEAYPAGEWKHGPNAMSTPETPLMMLAAYDRDDQDSVRRYDRVLALMRDMRAQETPVVAIANERDPSVGELAQMMIPVRPTTDSLRAIAAVIPLQLISYFMAIERGVDVDRPRNLVKAVREE